MSVGFRATPEDNEIIRAHKRPEESTSDVLRRALRALDREAWQQQARDDMERIAASGEDLSEEPDDWGFDEGGNFVDLRRRSPAEPATPSEPSSVQDALEALAIAGQVATSGPAMAQGMSRRDAWQALRGVVEFVGFDESVKLGPPVIPAAMPPDARELYEGSAGLMGRPHGLSGAGIFRGGKAEAPVLRVVREAEPPTGGHRSPVPATLSTPPKLARLRAAAARKARTR
ncbi:hypothetical protein ACPCSG_23800 [Streptomyces cellulosae]